MDNHPAGHHLKARETPLRLSKELTPSVTCGDLDAHPPQFREASHTPSNGHRLRLGRRLPQQLFRTQGPRPALVGWCPTRACPTRACPTRATSPRLADSAPWRTTRSNTATTSTC